MDGHTLSQQFLQLLPWLALAVGVGSVALTLLAFAVFVITHVLGPKEDPAHGHAHAGHEAHGGHGHGAH
jgi:hypothetical protein